MGKSSKKVSKPRKRKPKRHRPVTEVEIKMGKAELISHLHHLNKQQVQLKTDQKVVSSEKLQKLQSIEKQINKLGGIETYQQASKAGEYCHGNYNTAKWVIGQLKKKKLFPKDGQLCLLDVGALDLNYKDYDQWISCTAIDLNPQKLGIIKADFLNYKMDQETFDVIVLSLVVNFVGDATHRGQMLVQAQHLCKTNGYVFVMLPLACLNNSRYFDHARLEDMMSALGMVLIDSHNSSKLSFKMFQKVQSPGSRKEFPKKKLKNGATMNNFYIILR